MSGKYAAHAASTLLAACVSLAALTAIAPANAQEDPKAESSSESAASTDPAPAPPAPAIERKPLGFAGSSSVPEDRTQNPPDFVPIEDRWRIGFPQWDRHPGHEGEEPFVEGSALDPYNQNVLKADYPIFGEDFFLELTATSDTIAEIRSFPIPSGPSASGALDEGFFGEFDQRFFNQNIVLRAELFRGDTAFRPKDYAIRVTPVFNFNYVDLEERNAVNVDVRERANRQDAHIGFQELFAEYHILDLSEYYDFLTTIVGIQPFTSDFRGFMYSDQNLGARLQLNAWNNRIQANAAWFHQLEKDTNSGLNRFDSRDQNVFIGNVYLQDFLMEGYTAQLSYHLNIDDDDTHFDDNGFLTRPAPLAQVAGALGDVRTKELRVHYLGWAGEGHLGRLNIMHQYYFAFGQSDRNEIAARKQQIMAHFAAVEASVDLDWLRVKGSFMFSSGDKDPSDHKATGFSAILDNPIFVGSGFSYWNRQNVPFTQTSVQLVNRLSLIPDLRSSKIEGQSNFVNPGLFIYNAGASARITPKLYMDVNFSYLRFHETEVLELLQEQSGIDRSIGLDYSVGVQYRPFLNENVILTASAAALTPARGFRNLYTAKTLYSGFLAVTLTY
ncbi:MAG: hypothetical protein ACYS22_04245 [Planctomycetota bacterium]|jgi:hypothetical protein